MSSPSIHKKIRNERNGTTNSNDRWHATKGITSAIKKIGCGAKKNEGKMWSSQLADKGALLKTHFYWAIDKCDGDGDRCITHLQNDHSNCVPDSSCRKAPYIPSFEVITDPIAVRLLTDFIHAHTIYKSPFCMAATPDMLKAATTLLLITAAASLPRPRSDQSPHCGQAAASLPQPLPHALA